eukprot:TRINITY_DN13349_c0_g1_i1.p1 TRINITY_DN13349_c0_g1~~TRINITY_DN13349_c0_g1_i1.p1  ORF type:complete len:70 (-),score=5.79 TRINITY_DN13349_c0_g1_i1:148-357(-)
MLGDMYVGKTSLLWRFKNWGQSEYATLSIRLQMHPQFPELSLQPDLEFLRILNPHMKIRMIIHMILLLL